MKSMLIAVAAAASLAVAGAASAQSGAELAQSKCGMCHAADVKKVGPAFKDVAAKYKDNKDAQAKIVSMLKDGTGHAKIAASDADLATLAKYALAGGK
jgi:cytochrome c